MKNKDLELQLEKNKVIEEYNRKKKERIKILLHNLGESNKILMIFAVGLSLAIIFFLAFFAIVDLFGEAYPIHSLVILIFLFFLYGCMFHNLIQPYIKLNYKKYNEK